MKTLIALTVVAPFLLPFPAEAWCPAHYSECRGYGYGYGYGGYRDYHPYPYRGYFWADQLRLIVEVQQANADREHEARERALDREQEGRDEESRAAQTLEMIRIAREVK